MSTKTHDLPEPRIDLQAPETLPVVEATPVVPLIDPKRTAAPPTFVDRFLAILATVDRVVEYLVELAENLQAPGEKKREWVKKEARAWIRYLEGRFDLLPGIFEAIALRLADVLLDLAIDRAFRRLERAGIVNAHK